MKVYRTESREELISMFSSSPDRAFSLEEIAQALFPEEGGRSTMYRQLSRLAEEGRIRKISDGRTRHFTYQYMTCGGKDEHLHLKCERCGRLIHLNHDVSNALRKQLANTADFALNENNTLLFGLCGQCRDGQKAK